MTTTHHIRCNGSTHYVKGNAPHQSLPVFEGMATGDNNILPSAMFTSMVKVHGFRFLIFTIGFGKACVMCHTCYQVHFAKLQNQLCPIVQSTLLSHHCQGVNSTSPRKHCQIAKSKFALWIAQMSFKSCPQNFSILGCPVTDF